jgi:hypothetical protein
MGRFGVTDNELVLIAGSLTPVALLFRRQAQAREIKLALVWIAPMISNRHHHGRK